MLGSIFSGLSDDDMPKGLIEGYRLSPQQKRLWRLPGKSSAYHTQCAVSLRGALDSQLLKRALQSAVDRHEILRMDFAALPSMEIPLQMPNSEARLNYREVHLADRGNSGWEATVDDYYRHDERQGFKSDGISPIEFSVFKVATDHHILLIRSASFCTDYDSCVNLTQEIIELYHRLSLGATLPDEPVQYIQYSEWLNELS